MGLSNEIISHDSLYSISWIVKLPFPYLIRVFINIPHCLSIRLLWMKSFCYYMLEASLLLRLNYSERRARFYWEAVFRIININSNIEDIISVKFSHLLIIIISNCVIFLKFKIICRILYKYDKFDQNIVINLRFNQFSYKFELFYHRFFTLLAPQKFMQDSIR